MKISLATEKDADIYRYPSKRKALIGKDEAREITLPDLHGNAMKLLYTLMQEGVVDFPSFSVDEQGQEHSLTSKDKAKLYASLVKIYTTSPHDLTKDDIQHFNQIIDSLNIRDSKVLFRLIGDEFGDRGSNDYFTLKILERLQKYDDKIRVVSTISNHSADFIASYYDAINSSDDNVNPFRVRSFSPVSQGKSITNLQLIINKGLVEKEEVLDLAGKYFLPNLKAIDYSINDDKDGLIIYSHAPIGVNTIKDIAELLDVDFNDDSIEEFADTLDKINDNFAYLVRKGKVMEHLVKKKEGEKEGPLRLLIWNRKYENLERPEQYIFVHGHDSVEPSKDNKINIDDLLGKAATFKGKYSILETKGSISLKNLHENESSNSYSQSSEAHEVPNLAKIRLNELKDNKADPFFKLLQKVEDYRVKHAKILSDVRINDSKNKQKLERLEKTSFNPSRISSSDSKVKKAERLLDILCSAKSEEKITKLQEFVEKDIGQIKRYWGTAIIDKPTLQKLIEKTLKEVAKEQKKDEKLKLREDQYASRSSKKSFLLNFEKGNVNSHDQEEVESDVELDHDNAAGVGPARRND